MSRYQDRPNSSQLVDLAVYVVPPELWREQLHSTQAQNIPDTISAGFIRVDPELHISRLRQELDAQLGEEQILPRDYAFLKNVGRCLTKVRGKQERELKVKNFAPPQSHIPEIFLLEGGLDTRSMVESSQASYHTDEDPYQLGTYKQRTPFSSHKPVPPIQSGRDELRLPLSATPPTTPQNHTPVSHRNGNQQNQDDSTENQQQPPLSATPPDSAGHQHRTAKYTTNSNEDSGIGLEDAERRRIEELQRKQLEDEERRRQQLRDLEMRQNELKEQEERWRRQRELEEQRLRHEEEERRQEDARRQEALRRQQDDDARRQDDQRRQDDLRQQEERRRQEELRHQEELRRREEEMRKQEEERRRQEEERRRQEEERRRQEEERRRNQKQSRHDDMRERETPSPAQNGGAVPELSAQEKQQLIEELDRLRAERGEAERRREDLVKRAKQLQGKSQNKRNQARDV